MPLDFLALPALAAYIAILVLLFAYGADFVYLTIVALRTPRIRPQARMPARPPLVTVQLPVYNELYVVERLIDAAASLEYEQGRIEIQVLDDSTDETAGIVAELVSNWRARGIDIRHIRRADRTGFKAGALAHGLALARGEVIAVFDADFVPRPDFLRRAVPVLMADPQLAFVQTRWGHINRGASVLTRLQALAIDGHFGVEQAGRWASGRWFNFNGTAGIWRRVALIDAGGWEHDTLTEDLDISYRAFRAGWRAAYAGDIDVPGELPVSLNAYRRQQHRWARGSFECAGKHLPAIWRADLRLTRKVAATLHLSGYGIHLLLLSLSLLYPILLPLSTRYVALFAPLSIVGVFNLTALAPTLMFTAGQRQVGRRWLGQLPAILAMSVLGAGMMVNTARAAVEAAARRPAVFERTPKFGPGAVGPDWPRLRYQPGLDPIVVVEAGLAALDVWTCRTALANGSWGIALYSGIFAAGLLAVVAVSVVQSLRAARAARRERALAVGASVAERSPGQPSDVGAEQPT